MKGTTSVGLWYLGNSKISLSGFSDSDFEGCKLDRKKHKWNLPST